MARCPSSTCVQVACSAGFGCAAVESAGSRAAAARGPPFTLPYNGAHVLRDCAMRRQAGCLCLVPAWFAVTCCMTLALSHWVSAAVADCRQAQVTAAPLHNIRVLQWRGAPAAVLHMWHAVWALAAQQQCVLAAGQPQPGRLLEPCMYMPGMGAARLRFAPTGCLCLPALL